MNSSINRKYSFSFFFLHAITCVVYGYGVYSLKARGYSASLAGECLAICSLFAFFLQAYLANFVDNSKKLQAFDVSVICAFIIFIFSIFNTFLVEKSIILTLVFIIFATTYITVEPLINTLYTKFANKGVNISFSNARACGSFSYAIFSLIFGFLTEKYNYNIVLYFFVGFALCLVLDLLLLNKDYKNLDVKENAPNKKVTVSYKEFIKHNKSFALLIFFLSLVYLGYLIFDNFMILVVEDLGKGSGDLGKILGIKAIIETLGIFFVFPYLSKKTKIENVLKIAVIGFFLKALLSTLASNIYMLYAIQILQAFSFALITPGMVSFASKTLNKNEITRGQALVTMAMVFGSLFASFLAGNIADLFGVKAMEIVACLASLLGMIGFILTIKMVNKNAQ